MQKIGVESAHSFGDILFNIPLIKALSEKYNQKITVAVRQPYSDGFYNIPWVENILIIQNMGDGITLLQRNGYKAFQITQNIKFYEFKKSDPNHSLIDTPLLTGRQIGLDDFDQKPIFIPTEHEISSTNCVAANTPTIAIECDARSGQTWATLDDIMLIVDKYKNTHRILWLSNKYAPNYGNVDNLLRFSRRQVIMCLRFADIFFSVGSGFFCSSLALPNELQPKKIICLWDDSLYRYKKKLGEMNWHRDLSWIDNKNQLINVLENL